MKAKTGHVLKQVALSGRKAGGAVVGHVSRHHARFHHAYFNKPFVRGMVSYVQRAPIEVLVLASLVTATLATGAVQAATLTWDGGCGADTSWSCDNNWSTNTEPLAGDTVVFNSTSTNDSVVDASFAGTIAVININSGYTGTLSLSRSLIVSTTFTQAAGFFSAGSQTLDMNGTFTLSAGQFTASSGSTTLAGAMTISGSPAFLNNGGTFTFDGSTTATLSCNNVSFNTVTIVHTSGTKTVNSNCSLPLGSNPTVSNTVTLNGTLSGSDTLTTTAGTLTVGATGAVTGFSGITAGGALTLAAAWDMSAYSPADLNSSLTLNSGADLTAPSGTLNLANALTINSGATFTHNNGTVTIDGTASVTLNCNNAAFNLVTFAHTSGTKTVGTTCSFPIGSSPTLSGVITVSGTLSGSGTLTTSSTITYSSPNPLSGFSGYVANGAVTVTGASNHLNLGSYSGVDFNSTLTISTAATFTAPTDTMTMASSVTINGGTTFNHSDGAITFDGGGGTIGCTGAAPFNVTTFTDSSTAKTIGAGCIFDVGNDRSLGRALAVAGGLSGTGTFTISQTLTLSSGGSLVGFDEVTTSAMTINGTGTVDLSGLPVLDVNSTFTLSSPAVLIAPPLFEAAGNFTTASGATFTHNNGTLVFDGTTSNTIACNGATFNSVVFQHTNAKTVSSNCNLPLGTDPTIPTNLTLQGILSGSGTLTFTAGTLTMNGAASVFSGFSAISALAITVTGASANFDASAIPSLTARGNFVLTTSATFTAPAETLRVGGNFTISTGTTFNHNNGTIELYGANPTYIGSATFNNFVAESTASESVGIQFDNSPTLTILGELVLRGHPDHYLGLTAASFSEPWSIDAQGTYDIEYVSMRFGQNVTGTDLTAAHSLDNDHNSGWIFTPPASSDGNDIEFEDTTISSGLEDLMVGTSTHGAGWGDPNGDGYQDLLIGSYDSGTLPNGETAAPNKLFLGQPDGTFMDSGQEEVEIYSKTNGLLFVDMDNDGDQDLLLVSQYVAGSPDPMLAEPHLIFENLGGGMLQDITASTGIVEAGPTGNGRTAIALDYNADSYTDFFIHGDCLVGGCNAFRLVKNNGDMTFSDATAEAGLPTNWAGLGAAVGDVNGDSYPDIVASGDPAGSGISAYRRFVLFVSDGDGTYHESEQADFDWDRQGTAHDDWTAGAALGDLNRDGRLDLITTHHFESTYRLSPLAPRIHINTGNDENGDPIFERMPLRTLLPIAAKIPHVEIRDFDNDGWEDIAASIVAIKDGSSHPFVYRNSGAVDEDGLPSFIPPEYDYIEMIENTDVPNYSPGAPAADYDNDGRIDLFLEGLVELAEPSLWRNTTDNTNHWLKVKLGLTDSPQGIGARLVLFTEGHRGDYNYLLGVQEITPGNGYVSSQPTIAHFGLSSASSADLEITLPGGETHCLFDVSANQQLNVTEADECVASEPPDNGGGSSDDDDDGGSGSSGTDSDEGDYPELILPRVRGVLDSVGKDDDDAADPQSEEPTGSTASPQGPGVLQSGGLSPLQTLTRVMIPGMGITFFAFGAYRLNLLVFAKRLFRKQ